MILKIIRVITLIRAWDIEIDTDFSSILLNKNLYIKKIDNILIYDISYKTSIGAKPLRIRWVKIVDLLNFVIKLDAWYYLMIRVIKFVIVLNIL